MRRPASVTNRAADTLWRSPVASRAMLYVARRTVTRAVFHSPRVMPAPLLILLRDIAPASVHELCALIAVSAWTASVCFTAVRWAELRVRLGDVAPRVATLFLIAAGLPVWATAAMTQPVQALQVAGASVALVFAWEAAGVLERLVKELI